jgi:hypothetical protein
MVFGFAVSAAMADATLYGSARFRTFWHDTDKEYAGLNFDDEDLEWRMGTLSRFGVNFKQGDITGKFELDARVGTGATSDTGRGTFIDSTQTSGLGNMRLRHLWGAWNFGAGELCIGQRHSLYTYYISQFGGNFGAGMALFGGWNLENFRYSQIRLTFGNLKIAFLGVDASQDVAGFTDAEKDVELPRLEIAYKLKLEPVTLDFMGGYQTYDVVNSADREESVDCYVLLLKGAFNFGPGYLKAIGTYRQNGENYGVWNANAEEAAVYSGGSVQDAECYSFGVTLGFKVSDMITLEGTYVYSEAENDRAGTTYEDENQAYGVLCKITPAPGVTIQPEIIIDDRDDRVQAGATTEQGQDTKIGVFWKIDFK